jgi:Na+-transporting NADH:ubiquinone oxidoreductase subunit A
MHFRIRQGLKIPIAGAPRQDIGSGADPSRVGLSAADFPGIRPKVLVARGDRVARGQPLFLDRRRKEIAFTAPAAGIVAELNRQSRGGFDYITIEREGHAAETFDPSVAPRQTLLSAGLWPAFLTRPFGRIPDPDSTPNAILVTAMDTNPLSADPAVIIAEAKDAFSDGLMALTHLTTGPIHICQAADALLHTADSPQINNAVFQGRHPAGLPGTHLDRLGLMDQKIWQIGYQAVIAIGSLMQTGRLSTERVLALGGPRARKPRLVKTCLGAHLGQLLEGEMTTPDTQVISGSVLSGRRSLYAGFYHTQITLLPRIRRKAGLASRMLGSQNAVAPMIPSEAFESVLPQNILPTPLMRALSVGDHNRAVDLGALQLVEEDVALLSYLCPSGNDYAALLRQTLDSSAGVS